MHIHILGICGTFMGGLAVLAKEAGHKVTGCDANVYPPMSTQLEALGIPHMIFVNKIDQARGSIQALLEALWGGSDYREPRTIDVHVRHLREKIERNPQEPELILTVRGAGYKMRDL